MNDIIDEVRAIEFAPVADEERRLAVLRRDLMRGIEHVDRRRAPRRLVLGAATGLVAAAAVTGVVVASVTLRGDVDAAATGEPSIPHTSGSPTATTPTPGSTATPGPSQTPMSVATVLATAAAASQQQPATPVGAFDLLDIVQTEMTYLGLVDGQLNDLVPKELVETAYLTETRMNVFANGAGESQWAWIQEVVAGPVVTAEWGREDFVPQYEPANGYVGPLNENWTQYVIDPTRYATLPRDPQALMDQLNAEHPADAGWRLLWTLTLSTAPTDLRATMYETAKLLPGASLVSVDDTTAVIEWRQTVDSKWMRLTFDLTTGYVTSMDWFLGESDILDVPSDVPNLRLAITHRGISDTAPAPTA